MCPEGVGKMGAQALAAEKYMFSLFGTRRSHLNGDHLQCV